MLHLEGLIAATYTPLNHDGSLNLGVIPDYVESLLASGMRGLYVCGSTGEGISLSVEERQKTAAAFVKATKDRVPVVVQVGANALTDSQSLASHAQEIGAAAVSANAPSYFKIGSVETLAAWTLAIAEAAPQLPFYYYHIPSLTGVAVDVVEYAQCVRGRMARFGGVKYTDLKVYEYHDLLVESGGQYDVLWGCDEMMIAGLAVGGRGGVGSTYALLPKTFQRLLAAWDAGDLATARAEQHRVWCYVKTLAKCGNFHGAQKALLRHKGIAVGQCKPPLSPLSDESFASTLDAIECLGYFEWER